MEDSASKDTVEAFFLDSLKRLTQFDGPLQRTLRQLYQAAKSHKIPLPDDINECLRLVKGDLHAVELGSNRIAKQLKHLKAFTHISALINSTLELDSVLEEVIDSAIALTEAERAYLVLCEENLDELVIRAARNWDHRTLSGDYATLSRTIIKKAIECRSPIITHDASDDERFRDNYSVVANDLRSIICIPFMVRNQVVGVLYADNRLEQNTFGEESIPVLTTFSHHAAIAIENARLYSRVKADLDSAKREIQRLQISVDRQKVTQQVSEITESDYFQRILKLSQEARKKHAKRQ